MCKAGPMRCMRPYLLFLVTAILSPAARFAYSSDAAARRPVPPYPPSTVIKGINWHWETHRTAAPGSDLWPVTWGPDGHLYVAWGDGAKKGVTAHDRFNLVKATLRLR